MKVLVTGSSGTVGTRLCEKLVENGDQVMGVDLRSNDQEGIDFQKLDLSKVCPWPNFHDFVHMFQPDIVIHLANNARVNRLVEDPFLALQNMQINYNVLESCRTAGIDKIIFASSREVYGNRKRQFRPINERDVRIEDCESPYSASKVMGEALCHAYQECYGIEHVIVRLSNVYGMYDFSDRVIPAWIKAIARGEPVKIFGAEKSLDFTYIDDAVRGFMLAIKWFRSAEGEPFNIASGEQSKLTAVAHRLAKIMGKKLTLQIENPLPGEVTSYCAALSRAHHYLGYEPQYSLQEGLEKTVEWYKGVGYV